MHLKDATPINYPVKKTGYYCVWTYSMVDKPYRATVEFRNSFGQLPAAQIPKLPFYGGLTIVYAVVGAYGPFAHVCRRRWLNIAAFGRFSTFRTGTIYVRVLPLLVVPG